jgi:hypothetical protein
MLQGFAAFSSISKISTGLKVPEHEIFDGGFFAAKEPIWSPDS